MVERPAGLAVTPLVACADPATGDTPSAHSPSPAKAVVRIASLLGPTSMGMVKLMSDAESGRTRHDYRVSLVGTPDEIILKVARGTVDIAMVPANMAAVLHRRTAGAVQVIAINTLGTLYVVERGHSVHCVADLRGRTICASGKGATPEYALDHILRRNGLEPGVDVAIEWLSEHSGLTAALATGSDVVALLPQPFVSVVQAQDPSIRMALDLSEEWDRLGGDDGLVMGVAIADRQWASGNPGLLADFLTDYAASTRFTNEDVAAAAELVARYGIVPDPAIAARAIPASHITCITGAPMKAKLAGYLQVLFAADPASVGGALPGDDFYVARTIATDPPAKSRVNRSQSGSGQGRNGA